MFSLDRENNNFLVKIILKIIDLRIYQYIILLFIVYKIKIINYNLQLYSIFGDDFSLWVFDKKYDIVFIVLTVVFIILFRFHLQYQVQI